jgi:thiol-disulfide isomerase/thioredoxin
MTRIVIFCFLIPLSLFSQTGKPLKEGQWNAHLQLNDSIFLPIRMSIDYGSKQCQMLIANANEQIIVNEISFVDDSVFIKMPVFDSEFRCKNFGDSLSGVWINHQRKEKNKILFTAAYQKYQWNSPNLGDLPFSEFRWKVIFEPNTNDEYNAIGKFKMIDDKLFGTFETETGDYRYLQGESKNNQFVVSCFDGSHAFLFKAKIKNDSLINGVFYSGIHSHENFIAKLDNAFELRNPESLTFLKDGFTKVDFSFKNLDGKAVSLSDKKYKGKVVIIQLMGTWCPNCMDETKYMSELYKQKNKNGLEIIALAFERTDDFNKAVNNVKRSKEKFKASYDFLITMKTGAQQASEALPMLNKVMAFPTTIYIDKKGNVRKIYTGFYGPATGDSYLKFAEQNELFLEKLLNE